MNETKETLILALIECRIQNIRDMSMEIEWMADVMNFGWVGYDKHTDEELLYDASMLGWTNLGLQPEDFTLEKLACD